MKISAKQVRAEQDDNTSIVETVVFIDNKQVADKGFNLSLFILSMTDNYIWHYRIWTKHIQKCFDLVKSLSAPPHQLTSFLSARDELKPAQLYVRVSEAWFVSYVTTHTLPEEKRKTKGKAGQNAVW